ncbi:MULTISPECIES: hypothetical protein [unclassified Corynebacterium]|uniref:hypothetical protein n=1 Tax=unclassified Corynebacterium TaxID=2624378 RepID=UPI0030A4DF8F
MTSDLRSIGLGYDRWQDAIEAAIASDYLSVIGEVRGGQLVRFEDPSGARLHVLGVEPFATFAGFAGLTQVTAHVSALDDVLALIEIVEDDPASEKFDQVLHSVTCALAQSPLLVDEGTQTFEHVNLAALAVDAQVSDNDGSNPQQLRSLGAEAIVGPKAGTTAPDASVEISGVINQVNKRTNRLTGQDFWLIHADVPVSIDILLPAIDDEPEPAPGQIVTGRFLMVGDVIAPQGCGDSCGDGGCSCGSGGCSTH